MLAEFIYGLLKTTTDHKYIISLPSVGGMCNLRQTESHSLVRCSVKLATECIIYYILHIVYYILRLVSSTQHLL